MEVDSVHFDENGRDGVVYVNDVQFQYKIRNQVHEIIIRRKRTGGNSWEAVVSPPTEVFEVLEDRYPKFEVLTGYGDY
jgi:hypothetical protein